MSAVLANWKTSLTALIIVLIAVAHSVLGLNIPGSLDLGQALTVAIGLFVAGDGVVPKA